MESLQTQQQVYKLVHNFLKSEMGELPPRIWQDIETMVSKIKVLVYQYMQQCSCTLNQINIQHLYQHISSQFFRCPQPTGETLYTSIDLEQLQKSTNLFQLVVLPITQFYVKEYNTNMGDSISVNSSNGGKTVVLENLVASQSQPIQCLCQQDLEDSVVDSCFCYRCGSMFHRKCFWSSGKGLYECAQCYLIYYMPDRQVTNILFKSYIPPVSNQHPITSIIPLTFPLPVYPHNHEPPTLELRVFRVSPTPTYLQTYPECCNIYLDNELCLSYKPLVQNSSLKRRYDQPLILSITSLDNSEIIKIQEFYAGVSQWHLVIVAQVLNKNQQQIMEMWLKDGDGIGEQESGKYLRRLFWGADSDMSLSIQELRISNQCQYYRDKIKYPCRSKHCTTHYQPFDLYNFICSSIIAKSSIKRWTCPICGVRAYHIVRDRYLEMLMGDQEEGQKGQNGQKDSKGKQKKELAFFFGKWGDQKEWG